MTGELERKEQALVGILKEIQGCVIAFSGGLDSTYLAVMVSRHARGRVICVTIVDPSTPESDLESARKAAETHKLEHIILLSGMAPEVRRNERDRCYHCKTGVFRKLDEIRAREGLSAILDGENSSDSSDERPGSRAARECGIVSPLADAGLTKENIRELAKALDLEQWDRPASACLSSRIPFGNPIEDSVLGKVDTTESFIRSRGIRMIRARVEGQGLRLELGQDENTPENRKLLESLEQEILAFGWASMKVDPTGYMPAGLRK